MFQKWIDDPLIDSVFQPIIDFLRKTFRWSKWVLVSIGFQIETVSLIADVIRRFSEGKIDFVLMAMESISIVVALVYSIVFIVAEIYGMNEPESSSVLSSERVEHIHMRMASLVLVLVFYLMLTLLRIPGIGWPFLTTIGLLITVYAWSCTDLPPGETRYAKLKRWLREFRMSPSLKPE